MKKMITIHIERYELRNYLIEKGVISEEDKISSISILPNDGGVAITFGDGLPANYTEEQKNLLEKPLDDLDFSVRTHNLLAANKFNNLGEIITKTVQEIRKLRNFGEKSIKEIEQKLIEHGLGFKTV